jgi:hypothetical protein
MSDIHEEYCGKCGAELILADGWISLERRNQNLQPRFVKETCHEKNFRES